MENGIDLTQLQKTFGTVDVINRARIGMVCEELVYEGCKEDNPDKILAGVAMFTAAEMIMPSNEMRILTHDDNGNITYALIDTTLYNSSFIVDKESFRLEMKGRYTLRYVAYDEGYNVTTVERVFNAY